MSDISNNPHIINPSNKDAEIFALSDEDTDTLDEKLKSIYNINIKRIENEHSVILGFYAESQPEKFTEEGFWQRAHKRIDITIYKNPAKNNIQYIDDIIGIFLENFPLATMVSEDDKLIIVSAIKFNDGNMTPSSQDKNKEKNFEDIWETIHSKQPKIDPQTTNTETKNQFHQKLIYHIKLASFAVPLLAVFIAIFTGLSMLIKKIANGNQKKSKILYESRLTFFVEDEDSNNTTIAEKENSKSEQLTSESSNACVVQ